MSSTNGFAGFPARGTGRYAPGTRVGRARPWTPWEDALLWPVLLNCRSERAYLKTCVQLCEILGRTPRFPHGAHPTQADIVNESVALLEVRTVTYAICDRNPPLFELLERIGETPRAGRSLSWAECVRVLKPLAAKPGHGQPRVDWGKLSRLLARTDADRTLVDDYLASLRNRPARVPEDLAAIPPLEKRTVAEHVRAMMRLDADDLPGQKIELALLHGNAAD